MPLTPPWLTSILEEHYEELQMLWELRQGAVRDPDYEVTDLAELDERIEAHTDGLVLGEEHSQELLVAGLAGDEPSAVFAAAYPLLRMGGAESAKSVIAALEGAEAEEQIQGLQDALAWAPITSVIDDLRRLVTSATPRISLAAARALAFHGQLAQDDPTLPKLLTDPAPEVRSGAWRLVAILGG